MTPNQVTTARWSAILLLVIGVAALIADALSGNPVQIRYVVGTAALTGFCGTVLFYLRNGWPPSN